MPSNTDPAQNFNLKNLRTGSQLRTGEGVPATRGVGMKGALQGLERANRPIEYKNLSKQDVQKGAKVIEDKLRSNDARGGLSRRDVRDTRIKFDKMRRAGEISAADAKDFKGITENLKQDPTPGDGRAPAKPTSWW